MEVIPLRLSHVAEVGNRVFDLITNVVLNNGVHVQSGDVFVVTSKLVSYEQSKVTKLSDVVPSDEARIQAKQYAISAELMELIRQEADVIYEGVEHAVLTLKNDVLTVNAGIDNKNSPLGYVALWPENLKVWTNELRLRLMRHYSRRIGVIVTDSSCMPMRLGTVGVALAASGFKPILDYRGFDDLYGRTVVITQHALAHSIATAAHLVMGEGAERTPITLVRGIHLEMNDETYVGSDLFMPFEKCFFAGSLLRYFRKKQSSENKCTFKHICCENHV